MGYNVNSNRTIYNLQFADYPGVEVKAHGCSLEEMDLLSSMDINVLRRDAKKRLEVFEFFSSKIIEWNLEDDGTPIPPTSTGMMKLDVPLILAIVVGWAVSISRVALPKELSLNSGAKTGPSNPLPDGMTEEIMRTLEQIQSPPRLPEPNFTLD